MSLNQVYEAEQFLDAHIKQIREVQNAVVEAGSRFLKKTIDLLPQEVLARARMALDAGSVDIFVRIIRPHAAGLVNLPAVAFWDMVDAANFFGDAIGTLWPYMTQERRADSLRLAGEYAGRVQ